MYWGAGRVTVAKPENEYLFCMSASAWALVGDVLSAESHNVNVAARAPAGASNGRATASNAATPTNRDRVRFKGFCPITGPTWGNVAPALGIGEPLQTFRNPAKTG